MRRVSPPSPHQGVREEEGELVVEREGGGGGGGEDIEKEVRGVFATPLPPSY